MKLNRIAAILAILIGAAACSEDPIPIYISGNPRVDLVRDSIVVRGTEGETASIRAVYMTADGEMFAGGMEERPDGQFFQGDLWTHDGTMWRSALDASTRDNVLTVTDLGGTSSGSVYAVAWLKSPVGNRYSALLRREGDSWVDMSPSFLTTVSGCDIVSEDEIWLYGSGAIIPRYRDGEWEITELPEPWRAMHPNDFRVISISGGKDATYALGERVLEEGARSHPHILFRRYHSDTAWTAIYMEGDIEGAGDDDRQLQTLMRSRHGVVIACGSGVYRLDGQELVHIQNHPDGNLFRTGFLAEDGNMIIAGDGNAMRWSDGESWHGVHVDAPVQQTFISTAMSDTMIVTAGITGTALDPEYVLLHGAITRREP